MSKLDALLVNTGGTKKKVYQALSKDFSAIEPPFWAALTAGYLRKNGLKVDILEANEQNLTLDETAQEIISQNASFTVIVVYSQQANTCTPIMTAVGMLAGKIKALDPEHKVVLSGWHPSALPERTMREEACDYVVQGEGFYPLRDLISGLSPEKIKGLWWKNPQGDIIGNERALNIQDMDNELSDVAWDLLPMQSEKYRAFNWMCLQDLENRGHYASMYTSLGCPYQCSFCAIHATYGERKLRCWSPDWVMKQLDIMAREHGIRNINLIDELFVFNRDHYLPICEELLKREYKLNFCAFARVDSVDRIPDEDLHLLKKAGFNWLKLGIESVSDKIITGISKGSYNRETITRVVKRIHSAGIDLCANFIFGLPGDDFDSMQENLNYAFELNCAFPSFFAAMAPPGSDLYNEALEKGIALPDNWLGFAQQGYDFLPLPTDNLTAAEVLWFRDYAFDAYFANPRYLDMIKKKFGQMAYDHIKAMTAIKLKRRILEENGFA
jgi:radical SAM superfamily enzyme YgiQ (UPF0313 family)